MIKHLIVEAESDKSFIQAFLRHEKLNLQLNIDVATPQDFESTTYTTKQAVFQQLPRLVKLLETGQVSHIGILVDMDFTDKTDIKTQNLRQISERLNPLGFHQRQQQNNNSGFYFENSDYDNPIGVWLMPNNQDEGYLETWVKMAMSSDQQSHFTQIENFIQSLGTSHFKNPVTAMDKARIFTWLSTQTKPTQDLSKSLELIAAKNPVYQNFKHWLVTTFQ
jgi:hypothetical protein